MKCIKRAQKAYTITKLGHPTSQVFLLKPMLLQASAEDPPPSWTAGSPKQQTKQPGCDVSLLAVGSWFKQGGDETLINWFYCIYPVKVCVVTILYSVLSKIITFATGERHDEPI